MTYAISRRAVVQAAVLSTGAVSLLRGGLMSNTAWAQDGIPAGTVHSFSQGGVTFHSYVSPGQAVHVTSHVVELGDQLLLVDATMLPPTAAEVSALIASTGKPVHTAYVSHEHPDHWGGVSSMPDVEFATLPQIRESLRNEATGGQWPEPTSLLDGPDITLGMDEIGGVAVEFRNYAMNEAQNMLVSVFPEQKVAILQDLLYNGVYTAPGVDRKNWIATLESLLAEEAFDTLLVGHGMPASRGQLHTVVDYLRVFDAAWDAAKTPEEVIAAMKEAYPGYTGDFLLTLAGQYWDK